MSDRDPRELGAAYALGALSAEDEAAYETYLAESADARAEASSFTEAAAQLGLAADPVAPSPELKARVLAGITAMPQLPADPSGGGGRDGAQPATGARAAEHTEQMTPGLVETKARARWFFRPGGVLAAAAVAAALFIGGTFVGQEIARNDFDVAQATALAQLQTAADAQQASVEVAGGGEATLIWSLEQRRSVVMIDGLEPLPEGETYQLWYMGEEGAIPAGTLEAAESGITWRVLDGQMSGGDVVGLTVEPDGGSPAPTGDPLFAIESA